MSSKIFSNSFFATEREVHISVAEMFSEINKIVFDAIIFYMKVKLHYHFFMFMLFIKAKIL